MRDTSAPSGVFKFRRSKMIRLNEAIDRGGALFVQHFGCAGLKIREDIGRTTGYAFLKPL
jgi:hypothetical protein